MFLLSIINKPHECFQRNLLIAFLYISNMCLFFDEPRGQRASYGKPATQFKSPRGSHQKLASVVEPTSRVGSTTKFPPFSISSIYHESQESLFYKWSWLSTMNLLLFFTTCRALFPICFAFSKYWYGSSSPFTLNHTGPKLFTGLIKSIKFFLVIIMHIYIFMLLEIF